jgi:hypothetical protein
MHFMKTKPALWKVFKGNPHRDEERLTIMRVQKRESFIRRIDEQMRIRNQTFSKQ